MRIIGIIGPPFSGKGTQSKIIQKTYNFVHVSTGDVIRSEKNKLTEFGLKVKEYEEKGDLVPDELIEILLEKIIKENLNSEGVIIDGFPRTINQVDGFLKIIDKNNLHFEVVINLIVDYQELIKRAKARRVDSDRVDDLEENQEKRINLFQKYTLPAIEYLKGRVSVYNIDGCGDINRVTKDIINILKLH